MCTAIPGQKGTLHFKPKRKLMIKFFNDTLDLKLANAEKKLSRLSLHPFMNTVKQEISSIFLIFLVVKLREREGQRVDLGRSLKGHLKLVDGGYPFPDALH